MGRYLVIRIATRMAFKKKEAEVVLDLFLRWCRLKRTHILIMRLRLFAVKANANREQNLPSLLGQLCRDVALLIQRRKDGSCV